MCVKKRENHFEKGDKKMKKTRSPKFWLCIALVICLISMIGASVVQTSGGDVTIKEMTWETSSGLALNALLLKPDSATVDNPAPAIVVSHGWYNNKEMQDLNYVEYARRGYVVISISMFGHGDSDIMPNSEFWTPEHNANGLYDAVKLAADLPYVDSTRIGVTGHSNGGLASKRACLLDNDAQTQLIAAALIVSNDADYTDEDGNFTNLYKDRDMGIIACQYDEFFHRTRFEDGSFTAPRDFLKQAKAQSFLYFGEDPEGKEARLPDTIYKEDIDGTSAIRVIYNPNIIHPAAHISASCVKYGVEFFEEALGAPNPVPGSSQIWQWKVVFNTLGLLGFFMLLVFIPLSLVETPTFAVLKAPAEAEAMPFTDKAGKAWYWIPMVASVLFAIISYPLLAVLCSKIKPAFFGQLNTFFIGSWSLVCALFTLIITFIFYKTHGKKCGFDLAERGVKLPKGTFFKTVALAVITVFCAYLVVFIGEYLFKVDFRFWCLTIRQFEAFHFAEIWKYLIFFLAYYIMLSVSTNCFNYNRVGKKKNWNLLINAVFIALGPVIMVALQYFTALKDGYLFTETIGLPLSIIGIWLFPIIIILPVAVIISRAVYKKTNNPYIAGITLGLFVTIMTATNQLTQF